MSSPFVREGPITILRLTEGQLDINTGRYSPDTEEPIPNIIGNIQPVLGEDLVRAPEGARVTDMKTMFLHVEVDEKDILSYKGKRYQIHKTDEWDPMFSTLPHYRYLASLEGDDL